MKPAEIHIAPKQITPVRFQEYAVGIFKTIPTRSGIKKAIKKQRILVDGKIASTAVYIHGGETIQLFQPKENNRQKSLNIKLEVVLEDDHLAIIHKPAGISVSGNTLRTIDNALPQALKKSPQPGAVRPRPVHRLDYPTSGVLLVGKTSSAITALNKLFENKEIQKTYMAVTIGTMERSGMIDLPINDKASLSYFEVLKTVVSERFTFLNLTKLQPKTGRTHQLRKHLSVIGNPILGDKDYGKENFILHGKGLYLHAAALTFIHPFTKEKISVTTKLPKKFKKIFL